jgi:predicted Zn-dependent protease
MNMNKRRGTIISNIISSSICIAFILFWAACARVPLTNRQQIVFIPEEEALTMSLKEYEEVKKTSRLSTNKESVAMLKRVGDRVAHAAEDFMKGMKRDMLMDWEFILIEDAKTVNAWCMPGGKVAVYTGILPYTKTEAGLAAVVGHEIAHALAQHGNERLSEGLLVELGGLTLSSALTSKPEATKNLWLKAYGIGAQLGFILPYSRTQEYEADRIGAVLMAKAGYDPHEAIAFWERMMGAGGTKPPEFLSTHPADEKRIAAIKGYLPEAMSYYQPGK